MSETPSTDNTSSPLEAADACDSVAPISEQRLRMSELAAQLTGATERKRALRGKVGTMCRARQAAQSDAQAARQQWSAKLRDSDGMLTRDIQKLRANERSALSLAEEYEAMEAEMAAEQPRLDLELALIAKDCIEVKGYVAADAATGAYDRLLEQFGTPLAVAFELFSVAERANKQFRDPLDQDELAARFFGRLSIDARRRTKVAALSEEVDSLLALPPMDMSEVDMKLAGSASARSMLQARINAGSRE